MDSIQFYQPPAPRSLPAASRKPDKTGWSDWRFPQKLTVTAPAPPGGQLGCHVRGDPLENATEMAEDPSSDVDSNDAQLGYYASGNTQDDAIEIAEDMDSDIESSDDTDESETGLRPCAEAGAYAAGLNSGERTWVSRPPASPDQTIPSSLDDVSPEPWCSPACPSTPSAVACCAFDPEVNQFAEGAVAATAASPVAGSEFCPAYEDVRQPSLPDGSPRNEELVPEPSGIGD